MDFLSSILGFILLWAAIGLAVDSPKFNIFDKTWWIITVLLTLAALIFKYA